MIFDPKIDPQTTQDRPKTDPRGSSKPSFFNVDFCIHFWCVLGSILDPFGEPFGFQNRSQIDPDFCSEIALWQHTPKRPLQEAPRARQEPQEATKRPQEAAKRLPRCPMMPPRGFQEASKRPQEPPKKHREHRKNLL